MTREGAAVVTMGVVAAILSCNNGSQPTFLPDCPLGTFRPVGFTDCVLPADFQEGFSDNRCPSGEPALPPTCVSDTERPYYATSSKCAPGYRYEPGACERMGGTGGFAGFPTGGSFGEGGQAGDLGGDFGTGGFATGGDFGTGGFATGGDFGDGGSGGATGGSGGLTGRDTGGALGAGGSASSTPVDSMSNAASESAPDGSTIHVDASTNVH